MKFEFDEALIAYMKEKGKPHIIVEFINCENSDIEIADLHVFAADDKRADFFKKEKKYRGVPAELGEVLLPKYPLELEETVQFYLKKFWIFRSVGYTGIKI